MFVSTDLYGGILYCRLELFGKISVDPFVILIVDVGYVLGDGPMLRIVNLSGLYQEIRITAIK